MTEFTSDEIKKMRNSAVFLGEPGCQVFREALDHIERLQQLLQHYEDKKQTTFELLTNTIERRDEYIQKLEKQIPDLNLNLAKANLRITELEQERRWIPIEEATRLEHGFYLFEDKRGNHGIGYFPLKDGKVNFFDAVKIYNMKLYPPHMKPPQEGE